MSAGPVTLDPTCRAGGRRPGGRRHPARSPAGRFTFAVREVLPAAHAFRSAIAPALNPVERAGARGLLELLDRRKRGAE
ncbi:hypothetical protein GTY81_24540 [Streptomyces sp. SID8366]|uniref:hypothetical protein n=1 Tax=unclassified Streptomyces TaxID=2593676 RepID=UPI000DBA3328|nr:hypothetical protein [Streptomyces sp. PsTaAH-130]MYU06981.1 hypothetical protein [Streptomyces sp. SID8366]MYU64470.1 hypothetical protein [Streptomyces sp. SID69]